MRVKDFTPDPGCGAGFSGTGNANRDEAKPSRAVQAVEAKLYLLQYTANATEPVWCVVHWAFFDPTMLTATPAMPWPSYSETTLDGEPIDKPTRPEAYVVHQEVLNGMRTRRVPAPEHGGVWRDTFTRQLSLPAYEKINEISH